MGLPLIAGSNDSQNWFFSLNQKVTTNEQTKKRKEKMKREISGQQKSTTPQQHTPWLSWLPLRCGRQDEGEGAVYTWTCVAETLLLLLPVLPSLLLVGYCAVYTLHTRAPFPASETKSPSVRHCGKGRGDNGQCWWLCAHGG